jgi:hypothetical protein
MHRFVITTHPQLPGVRLACRGGWGNLQYSTDEAAEAAVKISAGRDPYVIERVNYKHRLPTPDRSASDPAWLLNRA